MGLYISHAGIDFFVLDIRTQVICLYILYLAFNIRYISHNRGEKRQWRIQIRKNIRIKWKLTPPRRNVLRLGGRSIEKLRIYRMY